MPVRRKTMETLQFDVYSAHFCEIMQIGNDAQTQTQVLMQFYVWSKYKIAPTNAIITVVLHLKHMRNYKCK